MHGVKWKMLLMHRSIYGDNVCTVVELPVPNGVGVASVTGFMLYKKH